jgi:hypothetical protein
MPKSRRSRRKPDPDEIIYIDPAAVAQILADPDKVVQFLRDEDCDSLIYALAQLAMANLKDPDDEEVLNTI